MRIQFLQSAFNDIKNSVGSKKSETGGILLGNRNDFVVQKFVFDPYGSTSPTGYDPDVDFINKTIKKEWEENNLALLGFVHSHPRGFNRLSGDYGNNTGDLGYLKAIFKAIPALDKFLVPIVFSNYDHKGFELIPYVAWADNIAGYHAFGYDVVSDVFYHKSEKKTDTSMPKNEDEQEKDKKWHQETDEDYGVWKSGGAFLVLLGLFFCLC